MEHFWNSQEQNSLVIAETILAAVWSGMGIASTHFVK